MPIEARLALMGRRDSGLTFCGISYVTGEIWALLTLTKKLEYGSPFSLEKAQSVRDAVARRLLTENILTIEITIIYRALSVSPVIDL